MLTNTKRGKFTVITAVLVVILALPVGVATVAATQRTENVVAQQGNTSSNTTVYDEVNIITYTHNDTYVPNDIIGEWENVYLGGDLTKVTGTKIYESTTERDKLGIGMATTHSETKYGAVFTGAVVKVQPEEEFSPNQNGTYKVSVNGLIEGMATHERASSGFGNSVNRIAVKRHLYVTDLATGEPVNQSSKTLYATESPSWDTFINNAKFDSARTIANWGLARFAKWLTDTEIAPSLGEETFSAVTGLEKADSDFQKTFSNNGDSATVTFEAQKGHSYLITEVVTINSVAIGYNARSMAVGSITVDANETTIRRVDADEGIKHVVASGNDSGNPHRIDLQEIRTAIKWWANDEPVPGTGGQTMDLETIRSLIKMWANDKTVSS